MSDPVLNSPYYSEFQRIANKIAREGGTQNALIEFKNLFVEMANDIHNARVTLQNFEKFFGADRNKRYQMILCRKDGFFKITPTDEYNREFVEPIPVKAGFIEPNTPPEPMQVRRFIDRGVYRDFLCFKEI